MKAIVKGLPQPPSGKTSEVWLEDMARTMEEGLRPILGEVRATPDLASYTVVLETEADLLSSDIIHELMDFFSEGSIRIEIPEEKLELVCL